MLVWFLGSPQSLIQAFSPENHPSVYSAHTYPLKIFSLASHSDQAERFTKCQPWSVNHTTPSSTRSPLGT